MICLTQHKYRFVSCFEDNLSIANRTKREEFKVEPGRINDDTQQLT